MSKANSQQFSIEHRADSGVFRAKVSSTGAALTQLGLDQTEIVGDPTALGLGGAYIGSTLAPWPNRIAAGRWQLAGESLSFEINEPERNTALHGLVHDVEWSLLEQEPNRVSLVYRLEASSGYPFTLELRVSYELTDAGLICETEAKNLSGEAAPFGLAFHPYFRMQDADARLQTSFSEHLVADENLIPTGVSEPLTAIGLEAQSDRFSIRAIDANLDHCLSRSLSAEPLTQLVSAGLTTEVWQDAQFGYLMVYTGRAGTETAPGYVAIEPQTMPADAFNTGVDLTWIEAGSSVSYRWGVRVTA